MARKTNHPEYYAIPAYQRLSRKTDREMATILGISVRTYKDKIKGYSDFTQQQAEILSLTFKRSKDEIFLT